VEAGHAGRSIHGGRLAMHDFLQSLERELGKV
jgi:hypothetical protein